MTTGNDRRDRYAKQRDQINKLVGQAADDGKLMLAGWLAFDLIMLQHASEAQKHDMRVAYMAGAQHLWGSVMGVLEPGDEPTEADERRMTNVSSELHAFSEWLDAFIAWRRGEGPQPNDPW